jgi:hypothetical protein
MPYLGKQPSRTAFDASDIPDDSITAAKIVDGVITAADIGANAVGTSELIDGAVTAAKIDAAVELGGPSLGASSVIRTNAQTISENITMPSTSNGMSIGPITIADTYTVTINGNWVII